MEMNHISVNPDATPRSEHGEITIETGVSAKTIYDKVIRSVWSSYVLTFSWTNFQLCWGGAWIVSWLLRSTLEC